jgi:cyclic beta-1,2-glucan synthetase
VTTDWPELDRLVNNWLPYQALTARLWGRCGPSQRGGAFGYRDQLQDVIPFLFLHPELAREQILLHAAQQFPEGDVLQWWHRARGGGTGLAGRNRTSDIQLWLPYLVTRYVKATGDMGILEEPVPFLEGRAIPAGEEGIGAPPRPSREAASLYEHCRRSIRYTLARLGCRGLPLIGTGDWNDGLSAVGPKGRGESVWLGFFLHDVLVNFTGLAERVEGGKAADYYRRKARRLARSLGRSWRETRFVRAFTDAGEELAYADALTAAWPTLSGAVDFERGRMALEAALLELERPDMVLLLTPPFGSASRPNPGKIAHYPEGVRENGGQYSHGSSWLIDAAVRLAEMAEEAGDHELAAQFHRKAAELWVKISPLRKTGPATLNGYGLPPHQQPADIYAGPGREGRGGWAWYTGSAARMLSAAYALLGLHMEEGELVVVPRPDVGPAAPHLRSVKLRGREMLPATATTTEAMLEPSR